MIVLLDWGLAAGLSDVVAVRGLGGGPFEELPGKWIGVAPDVGVETLADVDSNS